MRAGGRAPKAGEFARAEQCPVTVIKQVHVHIAIPSIHFEPVVQGKQQCQRWPLCHDLPEIEPLERGKKPQTIHDLTRSGHVYLTPGRDPESEPTCINKKKSEPLCINKKELLIITQDKVCHVL